MSRAWPTGIGSLVLTVALAELGEPLRPTCRLRRKRPRDPGRKPICRADVASGLAPTGLEGSDSAATATLLSILVRAHELGQKVALALTDDALRTIFLAVEAHLMAPIAASEAEALAR